MFGNRERVTGSRPELGGGHRQTGGFWPTKTSRRGAALATGSVRSYAAQSMVARKEIVREDSQSKERENTARRNFVPSLRTRPTWCRATH